MILLGRSIYGQASGVAQLQGTWKVQAGVWQLVTIPSRFGYWDTGTSTLISDGATTAKIKNYVIDQLEDVYGSGVVLVAKAYFGDEDQYRSFLPASTPASSPNNFPLAWEDPPASGNWEFTSFWLKSENLAVMDLQWKADN